MGELIPRKKDWVNMGGATPSQKVVAYLNQRFNVNYERLSDFGLPREANKQFDQHTGLAEKFWNRPLKGRGTRWEVVLEAVGKGSPFQVGEPTTGKENLNLKEVAAKRETLLEVVDRLVEIADIFLSLSDSDLSDEKIEELIRESHALTKEKKELEEYLRLRRYSLNPEGLFSLQNSDSAAF